MASCNLLAPCHLGIRQLEVQEEGQAPKGSKGHEHYAVVQGEREGGGGAPREELGGQRWAEDARQATHLLPDARHPPSNPRVPCHIINELEGEGEDDPRPRDAEEEDWEQRRVHPQCAGTAPGDQGEETEAGNAHGHHPHPMEGERRAALQQPRHQHQVAHQKEATAAHLRQSHLGRPPIQTSHIDGADGPQGVHFEQPIVQEADAEEYPEDEPASSGGGHVGIGTGGRGDPWRLHHGTQPSHIPQVWQEDKSEDKADEGKHR
mmetsp:Transcript_99023/g.170510  ORF Transcript_99023/g.170510 Transcript_99023/m.170510 type:complete len:263 (-) Transcript_99023:160-948(-)